MSAARLAALAGLALALGACTGGTPPPLPTSNDLAGLYGDGVPVELNGNVIDVKVTQDWDQLRRGGRVWARVGPYIYLFSPPTKKALEDWPGVGGVRVTTYDPRGRMIARALLSREALNEVTWKEAIQKGALARAEGTKRPARILDLIEYGEDLTQHEYSPRYAGSDG
jgi:hypothetical protein